MDPPWPRRKSVTLDDIAEAVDIDQLRTLLGYGSRTGDRVSRSYAMRVADSRRFPPPIVDHPRLRLWHRDDVHAWLDLNRPNWRHPT